MYIYPGGQNRQKNNLKECVFVKSVIYWKTLKTVPIPEGTQRPECIAFTYINKVYGFYIEHMSLLGEFESSFSLQISRDHNGG